MLHIIKDKNEWYSWLLKMDSYDFYHTYEYHHILKKKGEHPILIVYENNGTKIAIPFLKREINETYHDLTSVHGYLGPLSSQIDGTYDPTHFISKLTIWLKQENIVSIFSKLNPYIKNQKEIIGSLGEIEQASELAFFDQQINEEEQTRQYNRNTRQKIKQLRKIVIVKYAETKEDILKFIQLYHKSMERLNAKEIFYFQQDYFDILLNSKSLNAKILLAVHKDTKEIMGGVFCIQTKDIGHIELACTNELYFKESPVRILFDECRQLYKSKNLKYLNLGGGSGGRNGSLMRFKSSFTQNYTDLNVWKYIVVPEVYENIQTIGQKRADSNFFPKYRLHNLKK